jgi:hypothetical protein
MPFIVASLSFVTTFAKIQILTDIAAMAFCISFDNIISSVAIEQISAEDVLAAGMLVAEVLVLANECTLDKGNIISLALDTIANLLE